MFRLLHANREDLSNITSTRSERTGLLNDLLRYYRYHIEGMREVNSFKVLKEVMG